MAEYFVFKKSGIRDELEQLIRNAIGQVTLPRPIHTVLAQLREIQFVITTNYDGLLEQEIHRCRRRMPNINVYDQTNPETGKFQISIRSMHPDEVVIHKMHGSAEQPKTMVITQADYIRYLVRLFDVDRGMPEFFRKYIIPDSVLLFLGYSLEDWDFQVIWEGVLLAYEERKPKIKSYAIVKSSTEFQRDFWRDRNITVIEHDLTELARMLADEFNLEVPQLGIAKRTGGATP